MPSLTALAGLPSLKESTLSISEGTDESSDKISGTSSSSVSLTNLLRFVGEDSMLPPY